MSADPLRILQEVFGYPAFRGQQAAVVEQVASGGDALVLMPTGGGKSLCYQVPAISRHRRGLGVTVVVSPLIALMHDQVGALEEVGVHAAFLNSTLSSDEAQHVEREMMSGRLVLLIPARCIRRHMSRFRGMRCGWFARWLLPDRRAMPRISVQAGPLAGAVRILVAAVFVGGPVFAGS